MEVGNGKCRCGERKGKDVVNGVIIFSLSCIPSSSFLALYRAHIFSTVLTLYSLCAAFVLILFSVLLILLLILFLGCSFCSPFCGV